MPNNPDFWLESAETAGAEKRPTKPQGNVFRGEEILGGDMTNTRDELESAQRYVERNTPPDSQERVDFLEMLGLVSYVPADTDPHRDEARSKTCGRCHRTRRVREFGRNARSSDGLQAYCRECRAQRRREGLEGDERAQK